MMLSNEKEFLKKTHWKSTRSIVYGYHNFKDIVLPENEAIKEWGDAVVCCGWTTIQRGQQPVEQFNLFTSQPNIVWKMLDDGHKALHKNNKHLLLAK